ncbi:MAG: 4-hydroxybutyryl-CoA dehydratase, partial [Proteobacteria bacterium]|nr:4-hydroxybutyryl-CoA dehydratase [Pseudomonadota bacterium]
MGLKTKEEYIKSIRALKPVAYMFGERLTNIVDNPRIRAGIEATGATYDLAEKPENRDLMVTTSPLINEPVSRFTLPPASIEDLVARVKVNRKVAN